jgi:formate hydrogenlyase subunit 4
VALSGDLVLIAALFGLSRFASALALLDGGTAAGGLGAARVAARPALFEPVLLLVALCAATLAGAEASGGAPPGLRAPLLLAAGAVLLVAAAEAPRSPVVAAAEGGLPHDLADAPEAAGFEFSGWHLAFWDYARVLRSTLFLALLAALLPGPPALAGTLGAVLRPVFGLAELALLCIALAAAESGLAALHPERLPALGVGALVLAAVAATLLLLGGVAA